MARNTVEIVEVGPRDGLQNEKIAPLGTDQKIEFVEHIIAAGIKRIEVTSFVNPKIVPQMADADTLMARLPRPDGLVYAALVHNMRGAERAAAAGVHEINFGMSITTTFNQRNQRVPVLESIRHFGEIAAFARQAGMRPTIVFGVSFGCPFEGEVPLERLLDVTTRVMEHRPEEIGIADTIGVAVPTDVTERVGAVRDMVGGVPLRCHFHNTRNTGLANAAAAVDAGVSALDSSLGGIGGCPFAPKATGNIPTEDLFYLLRRMGVAPDLDIAAMLDGVEWLEGALGRTVPGLMARAGDFPAQLNALVPIA